MKTNRLVFSIAMLLRVAVGAAEPADSLFQESTYHSLVSETKAWQVGDVLTVVVQEAASATSSADLRSRRNFSVSARANRERSERTPFAVSASTNTENDGAGRTQRSGRLLAQLTVRVVAVNDNGDLVVDGQQSLRINGEEQLITLSGVVRRLDIGSDNSVVSSRIADAQIRFDGEGFVTDQSRPGWLARLVNFLGL